jgi:hypothetical protein
MNIGQTEYCGVFLYYFVAKDLTLPYRYVYGIRQHNVYPLQLVRTSPITEVDRSAGLLTTYGCYYQLREEIARPDVQAMYRFILDQRIMPCFDNELIGPCMSMSLS